MTELEEKLVECFDEMAVFKDLKQSNFFSDLKLPSFLRDWVLKKFEDSEGQFDIEEIMEFIHTFLPNKDEWTNIKNRIITENEHVKILTRISVDISIKDQMVSFSLPDFALTNAETIIEPDVWAECKDELVKGNEIWGVVELGYRLPSTSPKLPGKSSWLVLRTFVRTRLTWIIIRNLGLSLIFMNGLIYYLELLTTMQVDMLTKIKNGQSLQDFFLL